MNFDSLRKCYIERWSSEKINKWNEWNKKFSDDEIVVIGAKLRAIRDTFICSCLLYPVIHFSLYNLISLNVSIFLSLAGILVLLFILYKILSAYHRYRGIKNYSHRKMLFSIGIDKLKTKFHREGVKKHKDIMQKKYEESRKKEGK